MLEPGRQIEEANMDAFTGIAIGHKMGQMRRANAQTEALLDEWIAHAKDLERKLKEARQRIAVMEADLAGLGAQTDALLEAHPNTPLREKTSIRWKDPKKNGAFKSKLVVIYQRAFDKKARELGIQNPTRIRGD